MITLKKKKKKKNITSITFFSKMINNKRFDSSLLGIDKISFKSIDAVTYHIKCITMKSLDHGNIECENSLLSFVNNVDGYIEKENEDKYLIFASTDQNKEALKKYTEIWDEIKNQMKTINGGKQIEYKKDFMKIRFESDDDLPLVKY